MSSRGRWGIVLILGAGVQDVGVGQELDITYIKNHVERQFGAGRFQDLECFSLCWGERRDDAGV